MVTFDLNSLRQSAPSLLPEAFLRYHPGSFLQYFDDTPAKDPGKALSADRYDPVVAARKQAEHCSVCYSLQAFQGTRTKAGFLCYRNMGVDVDLGHAGDLDSAKQAYLTRVLAPFPLIPHWLTETAHGFHLVFRVTPVRESNDVARAEALNRQLVQALHGDLNAAILTQVFRVPGTQQFKDPAHPFLCRLLLDQSATIPPYPLARIEEVLGTIQVQVDPPTRPTTAPPRIWQAGLGGVPSGQRNAMATSLIGRIVVGLPRELWPTAGWG